MTQLSSRLSFSVLAVLSTLSAQSTDPIAVLRTSPGTTKVMVLGASLSKGMDLGAEARRRGAEAFVNIFPEHRKSTIGLGALLQLTMSEPPKDLSDLYLFARPVLGAQGQVDAAIQEQPELVIGIDLLFWFGYWPNVEALAKTDSGSELLQNYSKTDGEIEKAIKSLEKQAYGFQLIDTLLKKTKAVVVLGSYPDMFGANPLMLNPRHVPLRRTLDELNQRLRAYVERAGPRVLLFPLAEYVTRAKLGQLELPDRPDLRVTMECAVQADNLHPTRLGTVLVANELYGFLSDKLGARAESLIGPRPSFATLVERAGAQANLAVLLANRNESKPQSQPQASPQSKPQRQF